MADSSDDHSHSDDFYSISPRRDAPVFSPPAPRVNLMLELSAKERRTAHDVIEKEMRRRSGGSTLSSVEAWFAQAHSVLMKKMFVSHGTFRQFLNSFPGWFVLTESGGNVFVRFPAAATPKTAKVQRSAGPASETDWVECVAKIVNGHKGSCLLSTLGTQLKQMGLELPRQYRTLTDLLKIGIQRGRFVLSGSGGTATVSLAATAVAPVATAAKATKPPPSLVWSCLNCEFENTTTSNVCKVCFVMKGSRGTPEAKGTKKPVRSTANVVCDAETCAVVCRLLSKCDTLAIDCEGVNLGRPGGRLCLIQIAGNSGVYLFDGLADDFASLMGAGLRDLLENPQIVKVIHDCKMDACALFMLNGVRLAGVFDTQLAFSLMEKNQKSISLADLIKSLTGKVHPHKESAPHKRDPLFWSRRELVTCSSSVLEPEYFL
jgi:hypothetical protein